MFHICYADDSDEPTVIAVQSRRGKYTAVTSNWQKK